MANDKDALHEYLLKHAASKDAAHRALDVLMPFDDIDDKRGYPLGCASDFDVGELGRAIWEAFRLPVRCCAFLSVGAPVHHLPWPPGSIQLDRVVEAAYGKFCDRTFFSDGAVNSDFALAFSRSCGERLWKALDVNMAKTGLRLSSLHPSGELTSVLRMCVTLRALDRPEAKNLDPLANIMLRGIPMAFDAQKPSRWFVVVQ